MDERLLPDTEERLLQKIEVARFHRKHAFWFSVLCLFFTPIGLFVLWYESDTTAVVVSCFILACAGYAVLSCLFAQMQVLLLEQRLERVRMRKQ